jgi:hypothetical protein
MHHEITNVCKRFNLISPAVVESTFIVGHAPTDPNDISFNTELISRAFICLNRGSRTHRVLLLCHLADTQLLDSGYISYHFESSVFEPKKEKLAQRAIPITFYTTEPNLIVNNFYRHSEKDRQVYQQYHDQFVGQTKSIDDFDSMDIWQPKCLQTALVYLITETVIEYPYPWITEKTFKGILSKRPFILISSYGSLKKIQDLGFKTFNAFWDERYDLIADPSQRMSAIIDVVKKISTMSLDEIKILAGQLESTVEYNFEHYCKNFINNDALEWY